MVDFIITRASYTFAANNYAVPASFSEVGFILMFSKKC